MKPRYIHGMHYPTITNFILDLVLLFIVPIPIVYWIQIIISNTNIHYTLPFFIIYPIIVFVILLIYKASNQKEIYLFYSNFMLYKDRISFKDKIVLTFMREDICKLELYLKKVNYANIESITLNYKTVQSVKNTDNSIVIYFDFKYKNNSTIKRFIPVIGVKEEYKRFLDPFINYRIEINDSHGLLEAFNQEKRIFDYLYANKKIG